MWSLFRQCIFCSRDLPEQKSGVGEHVIPLNVYGFWCSYDVCTECMKYFGTSGVDKLAISNPLILESMKYLNSEMESKYEQLPFVATDTETKRAISMIRRDGAYKTKVTRIENEFLECSEKDFDIIAVSFIQSTRKNQMSTQELQEEIEKIKKAYFELKVGETYHSPALGLTIRKRQTSNLQFNFEKIPSITPLIAKIVFTAIHYFVPSELLQSFTNYREFRDHARYGKPIEQVINQCDLRKGDKRLPFHMIRFLTGGFSLLVDCTFFGYNNWRSILFSDKEVILRDGNDMEVQTISFYMDFSNQNKKKYFEFEYKNGKKQVLSVDI